MANHNDLGKLGEEIALKFLEEKGYHFLALNWTWGNLELDTIAEQKGQLIFVEVKTRQNREFGFPEEAIGRKKEKRIYEAAAEFLYQHEHEGEYRFDIISITMEPKLSIQHYPDAFFPIW